jgi:segregation and condensation protein A
MNTAALTVSPAQAGAPKLELDGFNGSLALLLERARAQRIDLATLSLPDMLDQLAAALQQAASLSQKADWLVMAAALLQLRSRLLLPVDVETVAAEAQAGPPCAPLAARQEAQALADWLGRQPMLGQDTFPRGQPELAGVSMAGAYEVDVIEFLWASLALFDDDLEAAGTGARDRPPRLELYSVAEARDRIRARLAAAGPLPLGCLLPPAPCNAAGTDPAPRRRSAWTSTFTACLEMAKQGEITLEQADSRADIQVHAAMAAYG